MILYKKINTTSFFLPIKNVYATGDSFYLEIVYAGWYVY